MRTHVRTQLCHDPPARRKSLSRVAVIAIGTPSSEALSLYRTGPSGARVSAGGLFAGIEKVQSPKARFEAGGL